MDAEIHTDNRKPLAALNAPRCQFIRDDGTGCGSAALKGRALCYFHSRTPDGRKRSGGRVNKPNSVEIPVLTDGRAIQIAVTGICRGLAQTTTMDSKRAKTLLYGLQIARSLLPSGASGGE